MSNDARAIKMAQSLNMSQQDLNVWADAIRAYLQSLDEEEGGADGEISNAYVNAVRAILCGITAAVAPRDRWEFVISGDLACIARSEKLDHEFIFGDYFGAKFFLESGIPYAWNIKHMGDEFWKHLVALGEFGEFAYEEGTSPSHSTYFSQRVLRNGRSNVYRIVRNHVLFEQNDAASTNGLANLGSLSVCWPSGGPLRTLLPNVFEAFKRLYRISYMLYRYEYIARSMRRRKP